MHCVDTPTAELAEVVMPAVLRWVFAPHKVDGKVVEVETDIRVYYMTRGRAGRR